MDRWSGLDEFVAVATCGSFTGAAQQLDTSVAQVSRRVKTLESELGYQLLTRTTRNLALTPEGQIFLGHARLLQHAYEDATAALRQRDSEPTGKIRLTAPVMYGEQYIMPLVHQFMCRFPSVTIDMELTNAQLDLVEQGVDLAIRIGQLKDSSLHAKRLSQRRTLVCVSPEYLQQHGPITSIRDLAGQNCLLGNAQYWRFMDHGVERHVKVTGTLRCNSGWALLDAAKQGLGVVQLPHYYLQDAIECKELVTVLDDFTPEEEGIWAVYPPRKYLSTAIRALIDFLAKSL
ncbi:MULTISPECIES: LysR family transcriptional regulator [Pseudoalteromonas]|uniref:LysR family transcriptional regulator n=1 Tax=Pseudoalteromonas viridis TaxID=339617 RepID=A0ABX7V5S0_9GAMM|nr:MULTISPECIES: LysR family transcriptional regulator [Pseudoalteromonas]QTL34565.1 LysR family transcriptional regulator [Pseudoalteromonas viridis]